MAIDHRNYNPDLKAGASESISDDLTVSDTLTVGGATTLSSTLAVTGALTQTGDAAFAGATTGVRRATEIFATGNDALTAAESGKIVIATKGSATQTFTLPAATAEGAEFTFKCGHASGEILLDPAGTA